MDVVYERCCGLDVHKKTVVGCVFTPEGKETRTFGTMTADLLRLGDWLGSNGVTHVAMESTGVFWKPIYNILEGLDLTLLVVNAQQIKQVPNARPTSRMRSGSPTSCGTACCAPATSRTGRSGSCRSWCGTAAV